MLKDFITELPIEREFKDINTLRLTSESWDEVEKIVSILAEFAECTTIVQADHVTLSDFYRIWAKLIFHCQKNSSHQLGRALLAAMKDRREALLANPLINATLFLDPRCKQFMSPGKRALAVKYLADLYRRINVLENNSNQPTSTSDIDDDINNIMQSLLNSSMDEDENRNNQSDLPTEPTINSIERMLREFGDTQIEFGNDLFVFWEAQKILKPELYKLATVIFSVSPSQATVERAFSSLPIILSPLRNQLSNKTLENLLITRLNRELFEKITID